MYSERFEDIAVLQLNVEGFERLTNTQKQLAYYLSEAGLWGRYIALDQTSEYNLPILDSLIKNYEAVELGSNMHRLLHQTLFTLFAHSGIYDATSGKKLPINPEVLHHYPDIAAMHEEAAEYRTVQNDGDVVAASGANFYKNLTTKQVKDFRALTPKTQAPEGFNERLVSVDGVIERQIISTEGLYAPFVARIVENLEQALYYTENAQQKESIETLINFYQTGSAEDFDTHCVAWTKDRQSDVYFINGLIESYDDPLGVGCTFESVVAFKNPLETAKVHKIIEGIQWLEDNLPIDAKYRKKLAVGLSASSINVISMAGRTAPTLPLGINLPNSDWIRKTHGSKSVNLANVAASRSSYEVALRQALFKPEYHSVLEQYANMTNSLHTDLHEIAGHGSGLVLEGVDTDDLGAFYSTIEESRADLVALYYMADPKLKDMGIYSEEVDVADAALAQYVSYITNGAMGQLRRLPLGATELTQAHFRNRQLIANWVLEHGPDCVKKVGNYIEVTDAKALRVLFGQLLAHVQDIKSTANFEAAKTLVMTYGTTIDQELHKDIVSRVSSLNMPKTVAFITPKLVQIDAGVQLVQADNFFDQQIELHQKYRVAAIKPQMSR